MGKLYSLISALLIAIGVAYAAEPNGYEWWFDNDVSSVRTGDMSGDAVDLQLDASGLSKGIHYFNFRLSTAEGAYGTVYRRMFHSFGEQDKGAISYEYWFDKDYASKVAGEISQGSNSIDINVETLPKGIHYFNCRVGYGGGEWGTVYRRMFHFFGEQDKGAISYEYWFDDDYASKVTGDMAKGSNVLDLDVSTLPGGLHSFSCRVGYGDGEWGTVYRTIFHSMGPDRGPLSYEYWFDSDYSSKVAGQMDKGSNVLDLDISSLPGGAHFFNCRVGYGDGQWGTIYRKMVLNLAGVSVDAVAYEYWLDNNYESKTEGSLADGDNSYLVDLDGVRKGLHRFNYRVRTGSGVWGSVFTKYFYVASNEARFTEYEYWLDKDYANRKSATVTANPMIFDVNLDGFDKSGGAHSFNLRVRDGDGEWGSVYRKILVFNKNDGHVPIIGYRHYINGIDLGYVELERTVTDSYMFELELADSIRGGVMGKKIVFDGDMVSLAGSDSLRYVLQLNTEWGWGVPQNWDLDVTNDFSTTAVEMPVNSRHTFDTPAFGKFVAVKFTADGVPLYFRTDVPVALDIYRDGEQVVEVSASQLAGMTMLDLEAGEYFGILHDAEGEAGQFTLHIMDTPNGVPVPQISFEDGYVTITCSRTDAQIRYTLDDPNVTTESEPYNDPFRLRRNAVVRALAFVPDSDLEPSEIAEYAVDTYKVETPKGEYISETHLLEITCATEDALISYRIGTEGEWDPYHNPIEIVRNCTVYARATFPGYNDSDIAEIEISEFKNAPIDISYNGRYATLTAGEEGATIKYTLDGTYPGDGQTYTSPVDVMGLGRIRAIVVKDGYMDSDIEEYEVRGYADDNHAVTSAGGLLESCYKWCEAAGLDTLRVEGILDDADYGFIRSLGRLRHLDIGKVENARIPDQAFAGTSLVSISMPEVIAEHGAHILSDNLYLSAVIWNSETENVGTWLTGDIDNPNVLIYVQPGIRVEDTRDLNVIEGSSVSAVTLHHGYPFNAPREFRAGHVSLTREFTLTTEIGRCGGWETIVLPFTPKVITHETAGAITPFAAWDGDIAGQEKPFWLYSSTTDGWDEAQRIEAYKPYIISMPNNRDYVEAFNLAGRVTFSADDVTFEPDSLPQATDWVEGTHMVGTFMPMEKNSDMLALNVHSTDEDVLPGSRFVDTEIAGPFEAYVSEVSGRRALPVFGDWNGMRIPVAEAGGLTVDSPACGKIRIHSSRDRRVDILTVDGMLVQSVWVRAGETVIVDDLLRNYYICGGIKVLVK